MIGTDLYTNVVYKECSELEVASRYGLLELRNGAPFYTLSGPPSHALHHEVPYNISYEVPGLFPYILHTNWYNFHTHWYVSSQKEGTNAPMFNLVPFSSSP